MIIPIGVEAPISDHSGDFVTNLEKYKVVLFFPILKDKNQENRKCFSNSIPWIPITMNF